MHSTVTAPSTFDADAWCRLAVLEVLVRRLASVFLALTVACAATACGGSPPATPTDTSPIRIGQIVSLTGNYQPLGTENQKSVALAVDQINAKGVLGRQLELIVKDDK